MVLVVGLNHRQHASTLVTGGEVEGVEIASLLGQLAVRVIEGAVEHEGPVSHGVQEEVLQHDHTAADHHLLGESLALQHR